MYSPCLMLPRFYRTPPLDLGEASTAPDFTALSFYKIFGFPDLGALIVRKSTVSVLERRKFFGGGYSGYGDSLRSAMAC